MGHMRLMGHMRRMSKCDILIRPIGLIRRIRPIPHTPHPSHSHTHSTSRYTARVPLHSG
jgi:hypothetical protein